MRAFLAAALSLLVIVVAGCGGAGSVTSSSAADPAAGGEAAQLVPPDALAFAAIDTDQSSQQWRQLDELTSGLGARAQVLQKVNAALAQHGLSYDADVKPALGPELDVAVLKGDSATPEIVAFAKPDDESKLRALASKYDQGNDHYTVQQIGSWSVVADSADTFAAVRAAQSGRSLADTSAYAAAQSQLSGDMIVRLYTAPGALSQLAMKLGTAAGSAPGWTTAKIAAGSDAIRASATAAGNVAGAPSTSKLLRDVPSGAALAVAFNGRSAVAQALRAAKSTGLPLQQLAPLLTGEGVLYVRARGLVPELAVELAPKDPQAALVQARKVLASQAGKLGPIQLTPQLVGDKLVIADSSAAATALRGGAKLVNDAAFKAALKSAGAPQSTSALVYANMPQLAPFLQLAAQVSGGKALDPTFVDTLDHLGSVVAWATRSGGTSRFAVWAQRR